MAWEKSCALEGCTRPLIVTRGRTKLHPECVADFNRLAQERINAERRSATQPPTFSQWPEQTSHEVPVIIGRPLTDPRNNPKFNDTRADRGLSPVRVGIIDIETTALNAGYGVILCAVVKSYGPNETKVFRADNYAPWKRGERGNDKELLQDILAYLEDIDILIGHNALRFDVPFIKTRALVHRLPPVNWQKLIDPVQIARRVFAFPGNSLDSIAKTLETGNQKIPLGAGVWQRAALNGDPEAMEQIVDRCISDVEVLDEITWRIKGYLRQIDYGGSAPR